MDIGRYVAQLRDDLAAAAAPGDEQTQRTAALLGAAVEPAARLALMNALADLAAEITTALGDRTVEVRLDGRDVRVAVGPEPVGEAATPPPPPRGPGMDTGDISRITLRLVEQIKGQAEQAAASQGVSLNSWLAQAVQGALSGQGRRRPGRGPWGDATGGPGGPDDGRHLRGWVQGVTAVPDANEDDAPTAGSVRHESRPVDGPAELDLAVDVGRVDVYLDEPVTAPDPTGEAPTDGAPEATDPGPAGRQVRVEIRHDPTATGGWAQRIGEVASWLGAVGGPPDAAPDAGDGGAEAVRAAEISWSTGDAVGLTVRSSTDLPLRMVPLVVTVWAPAGSRVTARTGAGDVTVLGRAGRAVVRTGAGTARTGDVDGDADITTGSGDVAVGAVHGRGRIRTGSGAVTVAAIGGSTDVKAGSGDVTLGEVAADVGVRTGTGAVQVADARAGRVELTTGSGGLRIGVHAGVLAELDLSSGSGRARSELDVRQTPPGGEPVLRLRGRTASGDVLVTRAASA